MTWWQKFEAWVATGTGIAAVLTAAAALFVAIWNCWGAIIGGIRKIIRLIRFILDIDEHHQEMLERLDGLDRGQLNMIETRAAIMDADERAAFFTCDSRGQAVWVSELWRNITGLSTEEAVGFGWESSIDEPDRPRVVQNWTMAVDHKRRYVDTVSYCHKISGKVTRAKVVATPIRDNHGTVLSYIGVVKVL